MRPYYDGHSKLFCDNLAEWRRQRRKSLKTSPLERLRLLHELGQLMNELRWPRVSKRELRVLRLLCRVYFRIRKLVTF